MSHNIHSTYGFLVTRVSGTLRRYPAAAGNTCDCGDCYMHCWRRKHWDNAQTDMWAVNAQVFNQAGIEADVVLQRQMRGHSDRVGAQLAMYTQLITQTGTLDTPLSAAALILCSSLHQPHVRHCLTTCRALTTFGSRLLHTNNTGVRTLKAIQDWPQQYNCVVRQGGHILNPRYICMGDLSSPAGSLKYCRASNAAVHSPEGCAASSSAWGPCGPASRLAATASSNAQCTLCWSHMYWM